MSIYLMVLIRDLVFLLFCFSIQDLETIKCQLTHTLIKYIPVRGAVMAACRPWLEDGNRWHIHFKWKQKMNLMLHIIFDPTQTVNKNSISQSRIFCVCSDVNTAKKEEQVIQNIYFTQFFNKWFVRAKHVKCFHGCLDLRSKSCQYNVLMVQFYSVYLQPEIYLVFQCCRIDFVFQ